MLNNTKNEKNKIITKKLVFSSFLWANKNGLLNKKKKEEERNWQSLVR